jgi:hippurate hydrolase
MPIINRIADFHDEMAAWRRDIHRHPETAFEEKRTADIVAARLEAFGIEVHRGLAGTGVVGTLQGRHEGRRAIGLRADMDALDIHELNDFAHRSQNDGKMHACGHDGHTAMLLGAARYLAETRNFAGTVHFIFQPAEENEGGARVMIEDGLFDRFPVEAVYGMHNWPGVPVGQFAVRPGPMMAAFDIFEIVVRGRGAHAAMPHLGVDPVLVAAKIVEGLQAIAARQTDPLQSVVVTVTQIHGGDTWNVIPNEVVLRGTTRHFDPALQERVEPTIRRIAGGICEAFGAEATFRYERRYPATINSKAEAEQAARAAETVAGPDKLDRDPTPCMGSEDFAFMQKARPGAYIWIGNGPMEGGCLLHNPHYDFNDAILPLGASYWATLAEQLLARP